MATTKNVSVTAAVLLTILGAVAGCSGPDEQRTHDGSSVEAPAVTASPTVSNLNQASLPLDHDMLTANQYSDLDYAAKLLASDCMKRYGITWDPGKRVRPRVLVDRTNRLGLVDEAKAARAGYHVDPDKAESYENKDATRSGRLTEDQARFLDGGNPGQSATGDIPQGGCYGEARRKIGWDLNSFIWLQGISNEATRRALADKRTAAVEARWSDCMAESGYRYHRPKDAEADKRWWKDDDAPASRAEINTAVADVRCKKKVNYVGEVTAVLTAYQQQTVEKNAERLETTRHATEEALKKAAAVLGGR